MSGAGNNDVIFFDGVCGFCDRMVQFVLARDRRARFRFAQLQGALARRELPPRGGRPEDLNTVCVLTADGRLLVQSRAVLFVMRPAGRGLGAAGDGAARGSRGSWRTRCTTWWPACVTGSGANSTAAGCPPRPNGNASCPTVSAPRKPRPPDILVLRAFARRREGISTWEHPAP